MNWTKREMLMQCLPAAADILALLPVRGADGGNETVLHTAGGASMTLHAAIEYVLSCLAGREDKELRLIRRNAARQLARRRNIILPILHGCVLSPVMTRPSDEGGTLGYINIARATLVMDGAPTGTDVALQSGTVIPPSGARPPCANSSVRRAPCTTSSSSTYGASCIRQRPSPDTCIFPPFVV